MGEQEAHDMAQELGISICIDLVDAHGGDDSGEQRSLRYELSTPSTDDTFEVMVFGTTVLGPKQATVKLQASRPLEFVLVSNCIGVLSAEPLVGAAFWSEEGATPIELVL